MQLFRTAPGRMRFLHGLRAHIISKKQYVSSFKYFTVCRTVDGSCSVPIDFVAPGLRNVLHRGR
jgi:hypothetical protein